LKTGNVKKILLLEELEERQQADRNHENR
jgi:hypothetical protein